MSETMGGHSSLSDGHQRSAAEAREAHLSESQASLQSFYDSAPMMMGVVEILEDDILHLSDNKTTERFMGVASGTTVGRTASELGMPQEQIQEWLRHYRECGRAQSPVRFEYHHPTSHGLQWLSVTVAPITRPSNGSLRCSYIAEDVTRQKHDADRLLRQSEALRESEEHLSLALQSAKMGSWELDLATSILNASPACKANFGCAPDSSFTYETLFVLIHPEDRDRVRKAMQHTVETRDEYSAEYRVIWPDGSLHWIEAHGSPICDAACGPTRLFGVTQDITERKQAEMALNDARARLEAALLAGEVATWTWDLASNRVIGDKNLARLYSIPPEDVGGGPIERYVCAIHPDDRARVAETTLNAIEQHHSFETEYRVVQLDGSIRWVVARGDVAIDSFGDPVRLPGVVLDITASKEAQLALAASEARARRFFEANVVGVIHWNLDDGTITDANDVFLNMVGYTREDLTQKKINWQEMTPPEWRERNWKGVSEIRAQRSGTPYEKEYFRKDGSRVPIIIGGALFEGSGNEGVSFILDISEQKRVERALRLSIDEIETLNARLKRSIQETHHRVKNNLQIISALADLQIEENQETIPASAIQRIGQHTRSLAAVHDLLTQEAKADAHMDSLSTRATLEALIPLLQATLGGRRIQYVTDDFRLPVREGASLALLISELISNAVKHGRGDIGVTLRVQNKMAHLEVCDDGPGFPPDFKWQKAANTGLDLIDSSGRYDLRGTISYENRPHGGARVRVIFPIPMTEAPRDLK